MIHITAHAIQRYQERVRPCSDAEATVALTSPTVIRAHQFGAHAVKLGTGQRIIIEGGAVVTVLPSTSSRGAMDPRERRRWA